MTGLHDSVRTFHIHGNSALGMCISKMEIKNELYDLCTFLPLATVRYALLFPRALLVSSSVMSM